MEEGTPVPTMPGLRTTFVEGAQSGDLPLVSVVIPAYNCGNLIGETLESVVTQDYPKFEVIVVDDGSTDNTQQVVESFGSDKVRYIKQANSGGPSRPRNKGIQEARGRYIALIDSDDVMLPGKIACAVALLDQEPDLGFIFTNFVKFDESRGQYPGAFLDTYEYFRNLPKRRIGKSCYVIRSAAAYDGLVSENYVGTSSVVIRKAVFDRVGLFDESMAGPEDFDMWLRVTSLYNIGFIDMIGHRYRVRTESITTRGDKRLIPHKVRILERELERSNLPSSVRTKLKRKLSHELWALGFSHQADGDMTLARRYYARSLREANYWRSWKSMLVTLLGVRAIQLLKKMRSHIAE